MSEITSIGPMWPPASASHERLRGFTPDIADTNDSIDTLVATFNQLTSEHLDPKQEISRVALRAIVNNEHLARLSEAMHGTHPVSVVEAALPITHHNELDNHSVVYLGVNSPERCVSEQDYKDYSQQLHHVVTQPQRTPRRPEAALRIVDHENTEYLVESFSRLYEPFDYSPDEVRDLLQNPDNTIAYLDVNGQIVSTSMAEHATIKTDAGPLEMIEITEASTLPNMGGRGYYTLCLDGLVKHLRHRKSAKVVYGESNLSTGKVITAAHHTGRRFSAHDADTHGIKDTRFGILPQNFTVQDNTEQRPYNDFAVGYYEL